MPTCAKRWWSSSTRFRRLEEDGGAAGSSLFSWIDTQRRGAELRGKMLSGVAGRGQLARHPPTKHLCATLRPLRLCVGVLFGSILALRDERPRGSLGNDPRRAQRPDRCRARIGDYLAPASPHEPRALV